MKTPVFSLSSRQKALVAGFTDKRVFHEAISGHDRSELPFSVVFRAVLPGRLRGCRRGQGLYQLSEDIHSAPFFKGFSMPECLEC